MLVTTGWQCLGTVSAQYCLLPWEALTPNFWKEQEFAVRLCSVNGVSVIMVWCLSVAVYLDCAWSVNGRREEENQKRPGRESFCFVVNSSFNLPCASSSLRLWPFSVWGEPCPRRWFLVPGCTDSSRVPLRDRSKQCYLFLNIDEPTSGSLLMRSVTAPYFLNYAPSTPPIPNIHGPPYKDTSP